MAGSRSSPAAHMPGPLHALGEPGLAICSHAAFNLRVQACTMFS